MNQAKNSPQSSPLLLTQSTEENLILPECFQNNEKLTEKFQISSKIGKGSFGEIYKAIHIPSSQEVAIKVEKKRDNGNPLISKEAKILLEFDNTIGFAKMFYYMKGDLYSYLVMSHLSTNLEKLKESYKTFSLKTVIMIGYQILMRIESFHSHNYLHRDIKPENFLIGNGKNRRIIYMIDFGLAKSFIENGKHIDFKSKKGLVGTARYASINAHLGNEQSRRDDLEAIGYMLVYLIKGVLPWQDLPSKTKEEKYAKILAKKQEITIKNLCSDLPEEFEEYFIYVKSLNFVDEPDYEKIKQLFVGMMIKNKYKMDFRFDWEEENYSEVKVLSCDKSPNKNKLLIKINPKKISSLISNGKTFTSVSSGKILLFENSELEKIEDENVNFSFHDSSIRPQLIKSMVFGQAKNNRYNLDEINENIYNEELRSFKSSDESRRIENENGIKNINNFERTNRPSFKY